MHNFFRFGSSGQHKIAKKLALSWIISYFAVFIIPFCGSIYLYSKNRAEICRRIYTNDEHCAESALMSIDEMISMFSSVPSSLANYGNTSVISDFRDVGSNEERCMIDFSKVLSAQRKVHKNASMIYVYFPECGYIISDSYIGASQDFFDINCKTFGVQYEAWKAALSSFGYSKYLVSGESSSGYIDFFYTLPLREVEHSVEAAVAIRLTHDDFISIINSYISTDNKNIYLKDKDGNNLFSYENAAVSKSGKGGASKDCVTVSTTSAYNGWTLVSETPDYVINSSLSYIKRTIIFSSVISLVISGLLIIFLTTRNYKPLKDVVGLVKKNKCAASIRNETELINYVLDEYRRKCTDINKLTNAMTDMNRAGILSSMLSGKKYSEDYLRKNNISFLSKHFAVIIFNLINPENLFFNDDCSEQLSDAKRAENIRFIISNVFEEIISRKNYGLVFEHNNYLSAVVNFAPDRLLSWQDDIKNAVNESIGFIQNNFIFSFSVSISNLHTGISSLRSAFFEAQRAFNWRSVIKSNDTLFFNEITSSGLANILTSEKSMLISSFIKIGNADVVNTMIDNMLSAASMKSSMTNISLFSFRLCSVIFDSVSSLVDNESMPKLVPLINHIDTINFSDSTSITRGKLYRLTEIACNIVTDITQADTETEDEAAEQTCKKTDDIVERIKSYISSNYSDPNLNVAAIGNYFNITPYYISNIFRASESNSLLNYIAEYRINAAKKLMTETDAPLTEISAKAGFSHIKTFIRTFTKFEGITPGKYRDSIKNK